MKKPPPKVTNSATADSLSAYREFDVLPKRLTLRFLAMLRPKELRAIARKLTIAIENHELPETGGRARKRRQWAQLERVHSEMRQRGMM